MEYDVNKSEFVKTQKTKYVIQTSKHIFQIRSGCIVHNDIVLKGTTLKSKISNRLKQKGCPKTKTIKYNLL